jgi:hypothetical protein
MLPGRDPNVSISIVQLNQDFDRKMELPRGSHCYIDAGYSVGIWVLELKSWDWVGNSHWSPTRVVNVFIGIVRSRACDFTRNFCVLRDEKVKNSIFAGFRARNVSFEAKGSEARQELGLAVAHASREWLGFSERFQSKTAKKRKIQPKITNSSIFCLKNHRFQ